MKSEEIVEKLEAMTGLKGTALADFLGVSKQSLSQYRGKKTEDLNCKIIGFLFSELEKSKGGNSGSDKDHD